MGYTYDVKDKEYTIGAQALKDAYGLIKATKNREGINVYRGNRVLYYGHINFGYWKFVWYVTLADGKNAVLACDIDEDVHGKVIKGTPRILNPDGKLSAKVNDWPVFRNGKALGKMYYIGKTFPSRGKFYNHDAGKIDTFEWGNNARSR